jgi:hypothetical protein
MWAVVERRLRPRVCPRPGCGRRLPSSDFCCAPCWSTISWGLQRALVATQYHRPNDRERREVVRLTMEHWSSRWS